MLYKVYVNLCDFTAGSYVTLGTTLYLYVIGMIHANYFCFDLATGAEEEF